MSGSAREALLAFAAELDAKVRREGRDPRWSAYADAAGMARQRGQDGAMSASESPHKYLSTSCLHADEPGREPERLHDYCGSSTGSNGETVWAKTPASCKHCGTPCVCWCHGGSEDARSRVSGGAGEAAAVPVVSGEGQSGTDEEKR